MQIKLEHKYFRQYLIKQDKTNSSRYVDTCKDIQTLEHVILNYKYYRNKQSLIKRELKIKVLYIKI